MNEFEQFLNRDHKDDQENENPAPVSHSVNGSRSSDPVEVPPDIRAVWGEDPNAALFIQEWGLEAFRGSTLHRMAVMESERNANLTPVRQNYVKQRKQK